MDRAAPFSVQIILTPPGRAQLQLHIVDPGSDCLTVQLTGELDASNSSFVAAVLSRRIIDRTHSLRIDLSGLDFCDWAGIEVLVWAHHKMSNRRGKLVLTGVRSTVARLLSVSQNDEALPMSDDGRWL